MKRHLSFALILSLAGAPGLLCADTFDAFVIRGTPIITSDSGKTEFVIDHGGDKAGLGSNSVNGQTLGSLTNLSITRYDDVTRFTAGSGPAVGPYLNIWITDGSGHFAVVANEPSNADFQSLFVENSGTWSYDLTFGDLAGKVAKIYENADKSWLPNGGVGLTFADLATFTILAPTSAQLTTGWTGLGGGAPRELGTNEAYGVNWVFGDTLSNYVSGQDGYIVGNASVQGAQTVPDVASSLLLVCLGFTGLLAFRRGFNRKS